MLRQRRAAPGMLHLYDIRINCGAWRVRCGVNRIHPAPHTPHSTYRWSCCVVEEFVSTDRRPKFGAGRALRFGRARSERLV